MDLTSGTRAKSMDGEDEATARGADDGADVNRVEDVPTTKHTSDLEMADNGTAEDALETVGAIIADITAAAVSTSTTDVDTAAGSKPTDSSQSTTEHVARVTDAKAFVHVLPLDVTPSDEPATIACVTADVKAAGTGVVIEMDTDAQANVTAVVSLDADVTKMDTGNSDFGKIDSDLMDTDDAPSVTTDDALTASTKNLPTPVTIDKDIIAPITIDKDIVAPVTADKDIVAPVTADKDITAPVTMDKDIAAPVTMDKDITAPVTIDKDITAPVTMDTYIVASDTTDKDMTGPLTIDKYIASPVTIDKDIAATVTMDKDIAAPVTIDKAIVASVTIDKYVASPVTIDKDIAAPVTIDQDIAAPVTIDQDIAAPVTIDKAIVASVTIDKDIAAPVTIDKVIVGSVTTDKDVTSPIAIDKDISAPVTIDKYIAAPVTIDKDVTTPITIDKDISAPVTIDKDIAAPVTIDKVIVGSVTADKDITIPVTTDKDVTAPIATDKDIMAPVTADNAVHADIATPLVANTETAAVEEPMPSNSKNDLLLNESPKAPETISSAKLPESLLLENITEKTDVNDTSMEDFSNLSLPSFSESKSSADQKFAATISECSFQKQRSLSEKSNVEDSSKGLPAIRGERDVSSLGDKLVNMQRPFRNIGEKSRITDDSTKYLDDSMPSFVGSRGVPLELPNSSSSKDLTLMMSAKDAIIMPDDSQHDSCNVDNIEIIQLIEDTTSASVSMDVDRHKVEPTKTVSAVSVPDDQSADCSVPVSVAEDSLLSKDSVDKSDLKLGEALTPTELPEVVPEDSCKNKASGKEANGGDVDMVEESQAEASGEGDKQGTDVDGSEREEDGDRKDKKSKSAKKRRPGICAETEEEDSEDPTMAASKLIEYQWPQEKGCEWYMLQEQVTEYLNIVSFKRKYPDLHRRAVEVNEKLFLLETNTVVSQMQCDLGLTALKSDQVHEMMARDYSDKFQEYAVVLQRRERQKITDHHKGYELVQNNMMKMKLQELQPTIDKNKLNMYMKKAVKSAAEYNSMFMKEKREERRAYFDLQTNEVHYPRQKKLILPKEATAVGSYPVALIPGQFQDYYKKYTSQELKYFPINTALYNPPRPLKCLYPDPNQPSEEETEEEKEEGKSGSSGKGENGSSSSSSSSDSSDSSDEKARASSPDSDVPLMAFTPKATRKPRTKASTVSPAWEVTSPSLAQLCSAVEKYSNPEPGTEANIPCNICKGGADRNTAGKQEDLVKCSACNRYAHPSCLDLAIEMVPVIKTYTWQCMECKTCVKCMEPFDEDQMMFCDHCDRGYHTYCVGVRGIPMGRWECPSCHQEEPPKPKRVRRR